MGTQSVFPIQTRLTRRTPKGDVYDDCIVVGGGNKVSIQPASFGETIEMTAGQINSEYEVEFPEGAVLNAPTYLDPGPTPEQQFAEMAREQGAVYDPEPPRPETPSEAELARMEEAQRVMAARAAEELARTNTIQTIQQQPQVGQASHEAEPVVKAEEAEANKDDSSTVVPAPAPAKPASKPRGKTGGTTTKKS